MQVAEESSVPEQLIHKPDGESIQSDEDTDRIESGIILTNDVIDSLSIVP